MKKEQFKIILLLISCFTMSSCLNFSGYYSDKKKSVKKPSLLLLELKGPITSEVSEAFMKNVRDYAGENHIKGVLIRVDSPGGTVGASQEINQTIQEIRNYYKKTVVVSSGDIVASGAVYSIVAADKIFINRGTLFGSIGVIMYFKNISELARWAKIEVYNLKAGEFKDIGNPYRAMTLREREIFENTLDNVLEQFKSAIVAGRNLSEAAVDQIADGRLMTGEEALELGFADNIGSFNDAIKEAGKMAGLGSNPPLFSPIEDNFFTRYFDNKNSSLHSLLKPILSKVKALNSLSGQPLYMLPSYLSPQ